MNAKEAKELSKKNLNKALENYLDELNTAIIEAANKGESYISRRVPYVLDNKKCLEDIKDHFKSKGYGVNSCSGRADRNPTLISISW